MGMCKKLYFLRTSTAKTKNCMKKVHMAKYLQNSLNFRVKPLSCKKTFLSRKRVFEKRQLFCGFFVCGNFFFKLRILKILEKFHFSYLEHINRQLSYKLSFAKI